MTAIDTTELRARVTGFERWHYAIDLGDGIVTPCDAKNVNRTEQRRRYFFERLVALCGGSLAGRRVLDLGCNAGYWSLQAIEAGADFVLGIDGRQMHVDQSKLVFEAKRIPQNRYRFELGNVFDEMSAGDFDVVLCLGLLYHVSKPMELFEVMAATGAELLVIDTAVVLSPEPLFKVYTEQLSSARNAVDYELVMYPSRGAVVEMARQFGYRTVPLALNVTDYEGMHDYENGLRVAFICSKTMALDSVPSEVPPAATRSGLVGEAARLRLRARGGLARLRGTE